MSAELVERLFDAGPKLSPALHDEILAAAPDCIPPLLRIVEDESLFLEDARGEGYAPIHAIDLLGELHPPEAIEPLIRMFRSMEIGEIAWDGACFALEKFGAAVLEPALAAYAQAKREDEAKGLLNVLSKCGVRDDRIRAAIERAAEEDPVAAAMDFAAYGDPGAIPLLERLFDECEVDDEPSPMANMDLVEIASAIERLGGKLEGPRAEIMRRTVRLREEWREQIRAEAEARKPAKKAALPGRNQPCWCGSGKKFKKCHNGPPLV